MRIITKSPQATKKLAAEITKKLRGGQILALEGDLGGGKTVFVQGVAKAFGIKENVTSPTFVILKKYKTNKKFNLIHIDLYRIKKTDLETLGFSEFSSNKDNLVIIEWADKIKEILPKNTVWIRFDFVDQNSRLITIEGLE